MTHAGREPIGKEPPAAMETALRTRHALDVEHYEVAVADADAGTRLDRLLARLLAPMSRSRLKALIEAGHVAIDGRSIADASYVVKPGERVRIAVPPPEAAMPLGEQIPLEIVFEDRHLIVIDKPAGLVVHPASGHQGGTLVNALIAHCGDSLSGVGGVRRPGIVHRLDKETSGLLVVAKSDAAHQGLQQQFAAHGRDGRLARAYLALVWGVPQPRQGRIEARVGRSAHVRTRMAVVKGEAGRHAATAYAVVDTFRRADGSDAVASLLRLVLETGRTHQIRVHLAHIGHPVMGDPVYGAGFKASAALLGAEAQAALAALGRQALHAAELGFEHPVTGQTLMFRSEPPADMSALNIALRNAPKASRPARPIGSKTPRR